MAKFAESLRPKGQRLCRNVLVLCSVALFFLTHGCKRSSTASEAPAVESERGAVEQPAPPAQTAPVYSTNIPPKSAWRVTASGLQEDIYPAHFACDDNRSTRWSSPPSDPQWIRFDLGEPVWLCGMTIFWETAYASAYEVRLSLDAENWKSVYATDSGDGASDIIYFAPAPARYIEIHGKKRATGWGYSIWEMDLKGLDQQPLVSVGGASVSAAQALFDGDLGTMWGSDLPESVEMSIDLRRRNSLGAVRIDWGESFAADFELELSSDATNWWPVQHITNGTGRFDVLFTPKTDAQFLRLRFNTGGAGDRIEMREISIKGSDESVTPLLRYQLAAQKADRGWYPLQLRREQVYWTAIGLPNDEAESLFDEFGNVEPVAGAPSLTPLLRVGGRLLSAVDAAELEQRLEDGHLPMPIVEWKAEGLAIQAEAFTWGDVGGAVTMVRYVIANESEQPISGQWYVAVRPVQINPSWQYGGLSHIRKLELLTTNLLTLIKVNDQLRFVALTPPDAMGVRAFDGADIAADLARGALPSNSSLVSAEELVSGALAFRFDLQPGATRTVILCAPLSGRLEDVVNVLRADAEGNYADAEEAFLVRQRAVRDMWADKLSRVSLELPDRALTDALRAQIAYIYINKDGPAIQPGPRNYNRSWIRDGSLTSAALLRMGHPEPARDFLEWYAQRVQPDGWVPPILNTDGTINRGFGWDNEYDSQGEYVFAVMDFYRFTRDRAMLERHYPKMVAALRYTQQLRERTRTDDYMKDAPGRERFVGILPPSISHEGYSPAMHSFWDDFWALKGWRDGAAAAREMGDEPTAQWCEEQYRLLRDALRASIEKTMGFKNIDYVAGCADKGDLDATSTAIAFFPCYVADELPPQPLRRTFERYGEEVKARAVPGGWGGGYTPYEWRNLSAFAALGYDDYASTLMDFLMEGVRPAGWRHWAEVVLPEYRMGSYIGDMPHTWVGAGFVTAVRGMVAHEADDGTLVLFEGAPAKWFSEGDGINARNLPTYYGPMDISARLEGKTLRVQLRGDYTVPNGIVMRWPIHERPQRVTVRDTEWTRFDEKECRLSGRITGEMVAEWE
jgi:hypothetical protein